MFKFLAAFLLLFSSVTFAEPARWGMGLGFESRYQREVNPDLATAKNMPKEYLKVLMWPWAVVLEAGQESRRSSSGSLQVESQSVNVSLWGRYQFRQPTLWSPFVGGGVGTYLDQVNTSFEGSNDRSTGRRDFAGLNVGVTKTLWQNLLVEAEGRGSIVQDSQDLEFSALIRMGVEM